MLLPVILFAIKLLAQVNILVLMTFLLLTWLVSIYAKSKLLEKVKHQKNLKNTTKKKLLAK